MEPYVPKTAKPDLTSVSASLRNVTFSQLTWNFLISPSEVSPQDRLPAFYPKESDLAWSSRLH